jgi:alpha-methylacyl-CoA racemase
MSSKGTIASMLVVCRQLCRLADGRLKHNAGIRRRQLYSSGNRVFASHSGPLSGIKVVELEGLAIAPYIGKFLLDYGADVVRIDRRDKKAHFGTTILGRDKNILKLDLKSKGDIKTFLSLIETQDILIDPYRPGVLEKLGIGPSDVFKRNERLLYVRVTGYGQEGPLSKVAGHDINYLAVSGTLSMFSRQLGKGKVSPPLPPINFLGDFAGGAQSAISGILMALFEREKSRKGQIINVSVVDGVNYMASFFHLLRQEEDAWNDVPGTNLIDTGAHFYDVYECADTNSYVAVGAIEPQFYASLIECMGLDNKVLPDQYDHGSWGEMKEIFSTTFKRKTRDEWVRLCQGKDTCLSPVLSMDEALNHPHAMERDMCNPALMKEANEFSPSPPIRFSRTPNVSFVYSQPKFKV